MTGKDMTDNDNNKTTAHNLTIGHCNIQGGLFNISKTNEIKQLIQSHNLDILCLNEINLNDTIDSCTLNLPATYNFIRRDRVGKSRGGCGMLISKKCAYSEISMPTEMENIEAIWIKIKTYNIYVCAFYRSNTYCCVDKFVNYIDECMLKLSNKKVIWIGDININQNDLAAPNYKKFDSVLKAISIWDGTDCTRNN